MLLSYERSTSSSLFFLKFELICKVTLVWLSNFLTHSKCYSDCFSDAKMTAILDQKHYIEELNRHLSCTVTDLQVKMDSLEKTNSKLVEEVRATVCEQLL